MTEKNDLFFDKIKILYIDKEYKEKNFKFLRIKNIKIVNNSEKINFFILTFRPDIVISKSTLCEELLSSIEKSIWRGTIILNFFLNRPNNFFRSQFKI
jgi:ribosomal protein S3